MMEEGYESTNIHLKWLDNIYNQIKVLQDFERIAREGCRDLIEYLEIPINMRSIIMPEVQYKNLRFMVLELDILISNLSPVLKEKTDEYKKRIEPILKNINDRSLFLKDVKINNQIVRINILLFLDKTINYLTSIKSDLIKDISSILYLPEQEKKSW